MFVGRDTDLAELLRDLNREGEVVSRLVPVNGIKGVSGIGKTRLIEETWARLKRKGVPTLWIQPGSWKSKAPDQWGEALLDSVETNDASTSQTVERLIRTYQKAIRRKQLVSASGEESEEELTEADPITAWQEAWKEILEPDRTGEASLLRQNLRLIFVFDDYDQLSESHRKWIRDHVLTLLSAPGKHDFHFIVSGEKGLTESGNRAEYWRDPRLEIKERHLRALGQAEVKDLLQHAGLPTALTTTILDKSGGVPGEIEKTIQEMRTDSGGNAGNQWVDTLLAGKSESERSWILRSCLFNIISAESLCIYYPTEEAREAITWLRHNSGLKLTFTEGGYRVDPTESDCIMRWRRQNDLEGLEADQARAIQYQQVCEAIPKHKDRAMLGVLNHFYYFNEEVVGQVLDAGGEEAITFIRERPHYFDQTVSNLQIKHQFRKLARLYSEIISPPESKNLRARIAECWKIRRETVVSEIETIEDRIAEKNKELEGISREMAALRKKIGRQQSLGVKRQPRQKARQEQETSKGGSSLLMSLAWQGGGIGLLYVSIFNPSTYSIAYGVVGVVLIGWGLIVGSAKSKEKTRVRSYRHEGPTEVESELREQTNKNIRIYNLSLTSLENRKSAIFTEVKAEKKKIEALEAILQEPYLDENQFGGMVV